MRTLFSPLEHALDVFREGARLKTLLAGVEATEFCVKAAEIVSETFREGRKVLLLGNGGSASDAQHIAAEWTGRLLNDRKALPAIALTANSSDLTAIGNDYGFDRVFSRLVEAHGQTGDVLLAISTSGESPNVVNAILEARRLGLTSIGLTGKTGGGVAEQANLAFTVPSDHTGRIQECHISILHAICEIVDQTLFPDSGL